MDEFTFGLLTKLKLKSVQLIKLSDFEDKKLLAVKGDRTIGEYCWTCTPSLPLYIFKKYPSVTLLSYLDSDLYFYSSPEPIFGEMGDDSVMIIPHRFSSERKQKEKAAGIYNVSMLTFRRDKNGKACLKWWRERCLEWCYNRQEDGKVGDQMYLNQFPKLFKKVHVLNHKGAGLAPWNIRQYHVTKKNNQIHVDTVPLIFYHFLGLKLFPYIPFLLPSPLTNYGEISTNRFLVYQPYFEQMYEQTKRVQLRVPHFESGFTNRAPFFEQLKVEVIGYLARLRYELSRLH